MDGWTLRRPPVLGGRQQPSGELQSETRRAGIQSEGREGRKAWREGPENERSDGLGGRASQEGKHMEGWASEAREEF